MEIYAREEGGEEKLLICASCGSSDFDPAPDEGATGAQSWGLMTRLTVACGGCGREEALSWEARVRFRYVRSRRSA